MARVTVPRSQSKSASAGSIQAPALSSPSQTSGSGAGSTSATKKIGANRAPAKGRGTHRTRSRGFRVMRMTLAEGRSGRDWLKLFDEDGWERRPQRADVLGGGAAASAHDLGAARHPPARDLRELLGRPLGIEVPRALLEIRRARVGVAAQRDPGHAG